MMIQQIALHLTAFCEAIMFFMLFEAFFERRDKSKYIHIVLGVISLALMIIASNNLFTWTLINASLMCFSATLISVIFYDGAFIKRLMAASLGCAIIAAVEMIVLYGMMLFQGVTVQEITSIPQYQIMGIILSKVSAMAIFYVIFVRRQRNRCDTDKNYWLMFFVLFATSTVSIGLIYTISFHLDTTNYDTVAFLCSIGLFLGSFFALRLYEHLAEQSNELRLKSQYEQNLQGQVKHLDEMMVKQDEFRRFRLDLGNKMIALKKLLQQGDLDSSRQFVNALSEQFDNASLVIDTGNTAFDALVSTKKSYAESKGINFVMKVSIPKGFVIDPMDCATIFGNAFDNAIEACEDIQEGEKCIAFTLFQQEHSLVCKMTNTINPNVKINGRTCKKDKENHGYGLMNISEALKKYNSTPVISTKDGIYSFAFIIFTDQWKEQG